MPVNMGGVSLPAEQDTTLLKNPALSWILRLSPQDGTHFLIIMTTVGSTTFLSHSLLLTTSSFAILPWLEQVPVFSSLFLKQLTDSVSWYLCRTVSHVLHYSVNSGGLRLHTIHRQWILSRSRKGILMAVKDRVVDSEPRRQSALL